MFDDLDDLLDDIPVNKQPQKAKAGGASTYGIGGSKTTTGAGAKKKNDDEFDWDQPNS